MVVTTGGSVVKTSVKVVTSLAATTVPNSVSVGVGTHAIDGQKGKRGERVATGMPWANVCCSCCRR